MSGINHTAFRVPQKLLPYSVTSPLTPLTPHHTPTHRSVLAACWNGFHDPFSTIQYYIVSAGLSPGGTTIVPPTTLPPSETSRLFNVALPLAAPIYVTVQAYNGARLSAVASSNGVVVDDAFPKVGSLIAVDTAWAGSLVQGSQYASTAVRVKWSTNATYSPINTSVWTLVTRNGVSPPFPPQQAGSQSSAVVMGPSLLSDGELYQPFLTTCSAAGLCVQGGASLAGILVDSSPPVEGFFAASTPSAAQLRRAVAGGFAWTGGASNSNVTLAFVGFSDPHSGVTSYWVAVGSSYGQSDLSAGSVQLRPTPATTQGGDNVTLLANVFLSKPLNGSQIVYVSLWALNGVGLRSRAVQGSFRVDVTASAGRASNGTLALLRSYTCPVATCAGHCTCAARGQLCSPTPSTASSPLACTQSAPSSLSPSSWVNVTGYVPQGLPSSPYGTGYTALRDKLLGSLTPPSPSPYKFLEWTFGTRGMTPPGAGLLDTANDPIWRVMLPGDVIAVFSPSASYPLQDGNSYVFYVRAWLNSTHSVTFSTGGVTVDLAGPQAIGGLRVKEVLQSGGQDIDFSSNTSSVLVSWTSVFASSPSSASTTYSVGLGDTPNSANVRALTQVAAGTSSFLFSGLSLSPGSRYYSIVTATSPLQTSTVSVSDGFVVDMTPPQVGEVVDGRSYADATAQTNVTSYSARWLGFSDSISGIHHYELAVTNSTSPPPGASAGYVGVGIKLSSTLGYPGPQLGPVAYGHVVAVNNAGVRSADVTSDGVVLDATRPTAQLCSARSPEILTNPSFERPTSCGSSAPSISVATQSWQLASPPPPLLPVVLSVAQLVPADGCVSLVVWGSLSQTFPTVPAATYRLLLALSRYGTLEEGMAVVRARLVAPGIDELVTVSHNHRSPPYDSWRRFEFYFTATSSTSSVILTPASGRYGVVVDAFSVTGCSSTVEMATNSTSPVVQWPGVVSLGEHFLSAPLQSGVRGNWGGILDAQSGVARYMWALGTVPGGEQLMGYTSTGVNAFGTSGPLEIKHGMSVFASVLAMNNAGQELVVHSEGFPVDFTPPTVSGGGVGVVDGVGPVDLDYQSSGFVQANWSSLVDPESGIATCRWAIG